MRCKTAFGGNYDPCRCNSFKWKFIDIIRIFFGIIKEWGTDTDVTHRLKEDGWSVKLLLEENMIGGDVIISSGNSLTLKTAFLLKLLRMPDSYETCLWRHEVNS